MHTWKQWLDGADLRLTKVLGLQIYWWARIGKLAQLLGALTILAEIVGPARLRSFSASLRTLRAARWALGALRNSASWLVAFFLYHFGKTTRRDERFREMERRNAPATVLYLAIAVIAAAHFWPNDSNIIGSFLWSVTAGGCVALLATPIVVAFGAIVLASCALAVGAVARPVAWILERPALEELAKVTSLILVVVGVFLELLTSQDIATVKFMLSLISELIEVEAAA